MTELSPLRGARGFRAGAIVPAVLCGGAGSRLWPVSRRDFAKQHAAIIGSVSPFRATLARLSGAGRCRCRSIITAPSTGWWSAAPPR